MSDIYPGAKLIQTAGYFSRPTYNPAELWSVIHTSAVIASAETLATRHSTTAGVTATFWVNRDGTVVQSLTDPLHQAPWTNGVWQTPDVRNPRIAAAFAAKVNPNRRTLVSIENVSLEPGSPITAAQEVTNAKIIVWAHALAKMPVSRETVIGHYQITAIDRPNCPARDKSVIDRIVALATGTLPDSGTGDDMAPIPASQFGHLVNRKSTLVASAPLYTQPAIGASHKTYPVGTAFNPVMTAKDAQGVTWYGAWLYDDSPPGYVFGYFRAGSLSPLQVAENPPDAASADCAECEAELKETNVALATAIGRIERLHAAAGAHATKQATEEATFAEAMAKL